MCVTFILHFVGSITPFHASTMWGPISISLFIFTAYKYNAKMFKVNMKYRINIFTCNFDLLHIQYCGKVINCIDVGGESSALIAGGGSDPILRIWDPRKPGILSLQMHSLINVINMHLQVIHTQPLICCNNYFRNSGS